jgi:MFS transporter, ACS family, glucarate transporter
VYLLVMVGLIHALLFFVLYRNSPRDHPLVNDAEAALIEEVPDNAESVAAKPASRMTIREMFSHMTKRSTCNLLWLNAQTILSTIADNIFSSWIPYFLFKVHDLQFKEMGIYSALPLLGGACGGAFGGWLNDFMIRRMDNRRRARSYVGLAGKGMAAVLLLTSLYWYDDPHRFCTMLFFVKFFSDWSLTTTWGVVTDIGGRSTATVFAWNNAIATSGAIAAPIMYGAIAEHVSWKWVFITAAAAYAACALSWLKVNCLIPVIDEGDE